MRFFFHICDPPKLIPDEEGMDLPDARLALIEAKTSARDLAATEIGAGKPVDGRKIIVANENGECLYEILVKDVIKDLGH